MKTIRANIENVILGTIICLSDGMAYGWTSPMIPKMESEASIQISKSDEMLIEITMLIGCTIGLPFAIFATDTLGRKNCMIVAALMATCCWILLAFADRIELILTARFFFGTAGVITFITSTIYVAEISEKHIRGFLCNALTIMMLLGIVLIYAIGPYVSVVTSSFIAVGLLVFQLCTFTFMPESPYYLLMKNQKEKARKSLEWFRNSKNVDEEMDEIAAAVERQQSERGKPQDLFLVKSNRKAVIVMTVLNASVHFSGFTALSMNLHSIINAAGSTYMDNNSIAIIFAVVMLLANIIASSLIDKYGRRFLLVLSCFLTSLSLFAMASCFTLQHLNINADMCQIVPMSSVILYAAVFKIGFGIVPGVLPGEMFPTRVKSVAVTLSEGVHVVFSTASVYAYQILAANYGVHVPIYLFAVVAMMAALFSFYFVPETKGKSLEEIQMMLKGSREVAKEKEKIDSVK